MAATATAPSRSRRRARKPAPRKPVRAAASPARPRRGITPAAGFAIPAAAVGRTAVAVGNVADSGLVVRLTRSRLWIGLVAGLLVGIVALNVYALSLSASGSKVAHQAGSLARENSALRAQLTERLTNDRIQGVAAQLGLIAPQPDAIRYLRSTESDAKAAANRLLHGDLSAVPAAPPAEPPVTETAPVAPVPVEPAPVEAVPVAPAEPTATTDPAAGTAPPVTP
jgi:hypothetical protein